MSARGLSEFAAPPGPYDVVRGRSSATPIPSMEEWYTSPEYQAYVAADQARRASLNLARNRSAQLAEKKVAGARGLFESAAPPGPYDVVRGRSSATPIPSMEEWYTSPEYQAYAAVDKERRDSLNLARDMPARLTGPLIEEDFVPAKLATPTTLAAPVAPVAPAVSPDARAQGLFAEVTSNAAQATPEDISARYTGLSKAGTKIYKIAKGDHGEPVYVGYAPMNEQERNVEQQRSALTAARMIARANPDDISAALQAQKAELDLAYAENPDAFAAQYAKQAGKVSKGEAKSAKFDMTPLSVDKNSLTISDNLAKSAAAALFVPVPDEKANQNRAAIAGRVKEATHAAYVNSQKPAVGIAAAKAVAAFQTKLKPELENDTLWGKNYVATHKPIEDVKTIYDALVAAATGEQEQISIRGVKVSASHLRSLPWAQELYGYMGFVAYEDEKRNLFYKVDKSRPNYLQDAADAANK